MAESTPTAQRDPQRIPTASDTRAGVPHREAGGYRSPAPPVIQTSHRFRGAFARVSEPQSRRVLPGLALSRRRPRR